MSVRDRVRAMLRAGLKEVDERIREAMERYRRGELDRESYIRLRCELELEKGRRVLENLRRMLAGRRSLAEQRDSSQVVHQDPHEVCSTYSAERSTSA